jgi:hypothetical protein
MKPTAKFLKERKEMRKAGFPYCYKENGVEQHCRTCIKVWKTSLKLVV